MTIFPQPNALTLKRLPKRAVYDREAFIGILEKVSSVMLGFVVTARPFVIPTGYARVDDKLLIMARRPVACCAL